MFRPNRITMGLSLLVIAAILATAGTAAAEPRHERQGVFLGFDVGTAGSGFAFEKDGVEYEYKEKTGAAVGLRIGYAFNPYFSLSLDGRGFGHSGDDFDYGLATTTLNATFYPMGGGFWMRVGGGIARFETELDDDNEDPNIQTFEEDGGAGALGLGYDWMVTSNLAVGLSVEARGAGFEDFDDIKELGVGESSLGFTMNYYF